MQRLTDKNTGSANAGVTHWIRQRATAVFLLYLNLFLLYFVSTSVGKSYAQLLAWTADPCHATHLLLYLVMALYHAKLGLQTVIEDYCHCPIMRNVKLLAMNFVIYGAGASGVVSLVQIVAKGAGA